MNLTWLLLLCCLLANCCASTTRTLRAGAEPSNILESLSNLRQDSFLEWVISILGPEYSGDSTPPPLLKRECAPCACGGVNTIKRIVGGQETEVHEYPWMALLMWFGSFYCGATLINDQYAITAAHCVNGFYHRLITVRLLEHDRENSNVKVVDRRVSRVIVHENYSTSNFDSDIALIRFTEPVKLGNDMHPVCLPQSDNSFAGQTAVITGWGALSQGGPISETLQEVEVPILSQEECRSSNYGEERITDNMICAGYVEEGGKDSCQGDSGGPMHCRLSEQEPYQLVGVVSWGEGCAKPGAPGVYTRVNRFNDWIARNTRDACACEPQQQTTEESTNTVGPNTESTAAGIITTTTTTAATAETAAES